MVYKKYIKRDGKIFGPYYYESYREDGKVKTRFVSGPKKKDVFIKSKKMLLFSIILLIGFVFLAFIVLSDFIENVSKLVGYSSYEDCEGYGCEEDSVVNCEGYGCDGYEQTRIKNDLYQCGDDIDNDNDCLVDEEDPGCWYDFQNPLSYNTYLNAESADGEESEKRRKTLGISCCQGGYGECLEEGKLEKGVVCGEWSECFFNRDMNLFFENLFFTKGFTTRKCSKDRKKFIDRKECDIDKDIFIINEGRNKLKIYDLDKNLISELELFKDEYLRLDINFFN